MCVLYCMSDVGVSPHLNCDLPSRLTEGHSAHLSLYFTCQYYHSLALKTSVAVLCCYTEVFTYQFTGLYSQSQTVKANVSHFKLKL